MLTIRHLLLSIFLFGLSTTAYSQGLMIKPMTFDLAGRPGETIERIIQVSNTRAENTTATLRVLPLAQGFDGGWLPVEGDLAQKIDVAALHSCVDWVQLGAPTVQLAAAEAKTTAVNVKIPFNARGAYCAALLVESAAPPRGDQLQLSFVLRFLATIRVTVQGPPARERVELADAMMSFRPGDEGVPSTVYAAPVVKNTGETFAAMGGKITIFRQVNGKWQRVVEAPIMERTIIPGATIAPPSDLKRRLPSGAYKIRADVTVNGRPKAMLEKELQFEGDPSLTSTFADASFDLPALKQVVVSPGQTRTEQLDLLSSADQPVQVECVIDTPPSLQGVAMGELKGDDLSCANWVEVKPSKFTIRPGMPRTLRVTARCPKDVTGQGNWYARLRIVATHLDGQAAGETSGLIWASDPNTDARPRLQVESVNLSQQESKKYAVVAKFANVGNIHVQPEVRAEVFGATGNIEASTKLEGSNSLLLPLSKPVYSGELDFEKVPAGVWSVVVTMKYGANSVVGRLPVSVTDSPEGKVVTVIEETPAASQ